MTTNFLLPDGIVAQPAAETPTMAMIEEAFAITVSDGVTSTGEVAPSDLGDAVAGLGHGGVASMLDPPQGSLIEHLDHRGESARTIGAATRSSCRTAS